MGREISQVMGYQGAPWLERPERIEEERPEQVLANLELDPGDVVADIGAGSGYYTFRLARLVPQGKVLAVDIQPEMLSMLREKREALGLGHVDVIQGAEQSPNLPAGSVDLAMMVDVYHELAYPREMMRALVAALRPGGRVVLLEFRAEDPDVPIKPRHKMSEAQARKEMEAVGLTFVENRDFLPWQHFLVFRKTATAP